MNMINDILFSAYSLKMACLDNMLAIFSLYISRLFVESHYDKVRFECILQSDGVLKQLPSF